MIGPEKGKKFMSDVDLMRQAIEFVEGKEITSSSDEIWDYENHQVRCVMHEVVFFTRRILEHRLIGPLIGYFCKNERRILCENLRKWVYVDVKASAELVHVNKDR